MKAALRGGYFMVTISPFIKEQQVWAIFSPIWISGFSEQGRRQKSLSRRTEEVAADLQIQHQCEIIYGDMKYSWDDYPVMTP